MRSASGSSRTQSASLGSANRKSRLRQAAAKFVWQPKGTWHTSCLPAHCDVGVVLARYSANLDHHGLVAGGDVRHSNVELI